MNERATLDLGRELRGRRVLASGSDSPAGELTDALVHPTRGTLLGLLVRAADGGERVFDARHVSVGDGMILLNEAEAGALNEAEAVRGGTASAAREGASALREGAYALRELVGASVVTDAGRLVGCVSEVHVPLRGGPVEYGVTRAGAGRFLGGVLRLSASTPHSFSRAGSRLIAPDAAFGHDSEDVAAEGRGWLGRQGRRLTQSARQLVYRYGVFLWFVISVSLISMMIWV